MHDFFSSDEIESLDECDLSVITDSLNEMQAKFDDAQTAQEQLDLLELATNTCDVFAEFYQKVKSRLTRQLDALKARHTALSSTVIPRFNDTVTQTSTRRSRLPVMQLAKFNGKYEDWTEFYAMFNKVVGNNEDLSKIKRLQHLRSCLNGAAIDTIKPLEPSEANYEKAMKLHIKRFDN